MRKSISFDVDTNVTKDILDDYTDIYTHVRKFLTRNGFEWQEGSVYFSKFSMTPAEVQLIVEDMYENYPYMKKCIRDMVYQNVGPKNSLNFMGDYDGTPGKFIKENTFKTKNGPIPKDELKDYVLHSSLTGLKTREKEKTRDKRMVR